MLVRNFQWPEAEGAMSVQWQVEVQFLFLLGMYSL